MAKLTTILQERFRKKEKQKSNALAQRVEGALAPFSGIFGKGELTTKEKKALLDLLLKYAPEHLIDPTGDLHSLIAITSEVKAINNQAVHLHGERIKKAQGILKTYKEGAFTAWLMATYGNRQTPYNFLQYYEFCTQMPSTLRPQIEAMPRQAIYTLASRQAPLSAKEAIIRNYNGETKQELIHLIRSVFPLHENDKRRENIADVTARALQRMIENFEKNPPLSSSQRDLLLKLIDHLRALIERKTNFDEVK